MVEISGCGNKINEETYCGGHVNSTDVTNLDAIWKCEKCGHSMTPSDVIGVENDVANRLRDSINLTTEHLEEELKEIGKYLHPNHYLLLLAEKHLRFQTKTGRNLSA